MDGDGGETMVYAAVFSIRKYLRKYHWEKTMQGLSQIIYIVLSELMKIKKCRKRKCDTLAPGLITP